MGRRRLIIDGERGKKINFRHAGITEIKKMVHI